MSCSSLHQKNNKEYDEEYQEGFMLGCLEAALKYYEKGIFTAAEIAQRLGMSEIELRTKLGLGFPDE